MVREMNDKREHEAGLLLFFYLFFHSFQVKIVLERRPTKSY